MKVGFIGIGAMGGPMVANVAKAGHDVIIYDTDTGRAAKLAAEIGATSAAKLADLADAEAMLIGKRFGLDQATMIDIMDVSTGKNFHTQHTMKDHVIGEKYATGFAVGLLAKDVKIAADLGKAVGIDAPVSRLISDRWAQARDELGATKDNSEAIRAWDKDL